MNRPLKEYLGPNSHSGLGATKIEYVFTRKTIGR